MKKSIPKIPENLHDQLKHFSIDSKKSISFIIQEAVETYLKLVNLARNEGNEYQDIPEAIDEMFECPATEGSLKMFFEQFAEQTTEEIK